MTQSLHAAIDRHFDFSELYALCFKLGIDKEHIAGPGQTKLVFITELIIHCQRDRRMADLRRQLTAMRDHVDWAAIPDPAPVGAAQPDPSDLFTVPFAQNDDFVGRDYHFCRGCGGDGVLFAIPRTAVAEDSILASDAPRGAVGNRGYLCFYALSEVFDEHDPSLLRGSSGRLSPAVPFFAAAQ